jgi:hypothetical protein
VHCVARRVPEWEVYRGDSGPLPWSPIRNSEPEEEILLVPFGAAKMRISELPVTI